LCGLVIDALGLSRRVSRSEAQLEKLLLIDPGRDIGADKGGAYEHVMTVVLCLEIARYIEQLKKRACAL
jgi:hypothetical protein